MKGLGFIVLVILFLFVIAWFVPWITIHSINGLFDINVEHSAINYLYFWIIKLLAFSSVAKSEINRSRQ